MKMNLHNTTLNAEAVYHFHLSSENEVSLDSIQQNLASKKWQLITKRMFDLFVSLLLILILAPILIIVTLIIKLTSRGPILFSNERVGLNGKHFKCHKFRSMVTDHSWHADHKKAMEGEKSGILHKQKNDTRITFIGKIIRKTSIDELPQLFNVLNGDMSIIGPRPLVPFMLKPYPEFSKLRCLMRPGITGLWQIRDREHNTSAQFMMAHDTEYIKTFSFFTDIKILFETPIAVISAKGAY